jgi:hypothetical protein
VHFPRFHTRFVNMGEIIEYLELRVQLLIFFFMHMSQVIKCSNSRRIKLEKERLVRLKQKKIQQRCRINRFKKLMLGRRKLFFCILMNLTSHSVNREIWVRFPIPVGKRIMVSLWRLATNIEFRTLGHTVTQVFKSDRFSIYCSVNVPFSKRSIKIDLPLSNVNANRSFLDRFK